MPPSNTSSPLSDAASLPNTNNDDEEAGVIVYDSGPSRLPSPSERRRRSRSETSSTVQLRPSRDDDSDLSDLSDEEEEEQEELGNDSDGEEEDGNVDEQEPGMEIPKSRLPSTGYRNPAGVATKASPGDRYVGSHIPHIAILMYSGNPSWMREHTRVIPIQIPYHLLHLRQDLRRKLYPKLIPVNRALY